MICVHFIHLNYFIVGYRDKNEKKETMMMDISLKTKILTKVTITVTMTTKKLNFLSMPVEVTWKLELMIMQGTTTTILRKIMQSTVSP